ncbi:TetR/AcrR family transcriptional regulator [Nonomuraea spiralis]|uniref:TetR/AcrR family transcriptional regulator n=1 Tax=Nonomuraea spiralis TaxID=46182 RepID=A0ABV5IPR7_9ACTN|nr:TetR/AcrR family transcriptional regulator [Nonomuraea spiralis]GGT32229.1 TetR family transcriptional regulator [Nonomuraea spiralis]
MPASKPPVPSVWIRQRVQRERPALSLDRIVSEAVRLLDEEGLEALSMRSLGTRLDAGATSLYRHVANKDELIELVVDEVYGELRVPSAEEAAGWRDGLATSARSLRAVILRHPWLASVLGQAGLTNLGPNVMRRSEDLLALVHGAGFAPGEADQAVNTLLAYVIGMTVSEAAYLSMLARNGQTEQEWLDTVRSTAEQAMEEHPRMRAEYAVKGYGDPRRAREEDFTYGLDRVLDGLEARAASSAA